MRDVKNGIAAGRRLVLDWALDAKPRPSKAMVIDVSTNERIPKARKIEFESVEDTRLGPKGWAWVTEFIPTLEGDVVKQINPTTGKLEIAVKVSRRLVQVIWIKS